MEEGVEFWGLAPASGSWWASLGAWGSYPFQGIPEEGGCELQSKNEEARGGVWDPA